MKHTFSHYKKEVLAQHPKVKDLYLEETLNYFMSEQLKKARIQRGFSQGTLAKSMKTTQSVIARIESGQANVSLKTLGKMLDALGMKLKVVEKDKV